MKIVAQRQCAFGNGTRPPGFEFGSVKLKGESNWFDFHRELLKTKPHQCDSAEVKFAKGVTPAEFKCAAMNLQMGTVLVDPKDAELKETSVREVDWREVKVSETKLSTAVKKKLTGAGIKLLGDVEKHTEANEGFAIDGIGKPEEKAILNEIKSFRSEE